MHALLVLFKQDPDPGYYFKVGSGSVIFFPGSETLTVIQRVSITSVSRDCKPELQMKYAESEYLVNKKRFHTLTWPLMKPLVLSNTYELQIYLCLEIASLNSR